MLAHWDAEKAAWGSAIQRKLLVAPSTGAGLEVLVKKVRSIRPTRVYLPLQTSVQGALRPCRTTLTSHAGNSGPTRRALKEMRPQWFHVSAALRACIPSLLTFWVPF